MKRCIVCILGGMLGGILCGVGAAMLLQPGEIVIPNAIGASDAVYSIEPEYRYTDMRYTQENGKLILEIIYEKGDGANDE